MGRQTTTGQRGSRGPRPTQPERLMRELIDSVGVHQFAASVGLSATQVRRLRSGAQPNVIARLLACLKAGDQKVARRVLTYICREMGGHYIPPNALDDADVATVKDYAEAMATIRDGRTPEVDVNELQRTVKSLTNILDSLRD